MIEADDLLVARSRLGGPSRRGAFDEIVRRTARLVYARIVVDVKDRDRAEDLTQEVFLIAWRSIDGLEEAGALRGWLLAIAASVIADDMRRRTRKKRGGIAAGIQTHGNLDELTERETARAGLPAGVDPAGAAEAGEEKDRALEALRGLPEEYRAVLTLRYLGGADYGEIAKQLALTNGSLRGLLHRGMVLLRKRLAE